MKLWQKGQAIAERSPERFYRSATIGNLIPARRPDIGSLAHIQMLGSVGLLTPEERAPLQALKDMYKQITEGKFELEEGWRMHRRWNPVNATWATW